MLLCLCACVHARKCQQVCTEITQCLPGPVCTCSKRAGECNKCLRLHMYARTTLQLSVHECHHVSCTSLRAHLCAYMHGYTHTREVRWLCLCAFAGEPLHLSVFVHPGMNVFLCLLCTCPSTCRGYGHASAWACAPRGTSMPLSVGKHRWGW